MVQVSRKVREAVCGPKSSALLASFDPVTCSLKTSQQSFLSDPDSMPCSLTLPTWGLMRAGAVYELPMLERLISGIDGGAWPTPSANNYEQDDLTALLARRERIKAQGINGNGFGLTLGNAVKIWPTPASRDYRHPNAKSYAERGGGKKGEQLPNAVGGSLNPTWVEWLMAWPLGWTVSKHWATVKSQFKRPSRGES